MSKKNLFMRTPEVSTYTSYGCLFSIMDDRLWPWIYNNFIQITYAHTWGIFAFENHVRLLSNCPGISYYEIPRIVVDYKWDKKVENLIIEALEMDYYVYIYVDRYYIKQSSSYQKYCSPHEVLICGYDLSKRTFTIADNLENGKFVVTECTFDEVEKGYWAIKSKYDFMTNIRYLKQNKEYTCHINLPQIILNIDNYLLSKKNYDLIQDQEFDYGFDAYHRLFADILNAEKSFELDWRGFHLLYEHKILMEMRIKYLLDIEVISCSSSFLEAITKLKNDFLVLRNLVIKYNLTLDRNILERIKGNLEDSLNRERSYLFDLLNDLKQNLEKKNSVL